MAIQKRLARLASQTTLRTAFILCLLIGLASGLSFASTYALSVSAQSSRNGGVALNGATVNGSVYIFTSDASSLTNFNPTGISRVCYWLDNTAMSGGAMHFEGIVPYDFAGTSSNIAYGNPWNANSVANGKHTITQQVTMTSGATEVDSASFNVGTTAPTGTYALSVSSNSNRSGGTALNGATLTGTEYIFTSMASSLTNYNPTGITRVCYWLDNTAMSGGAMHCEGIVPYDFAGTASNIAYGNPWSTTTLANGTHTITQVVTKTSGAMETDTASFKISNGTTASAMAISTSSLPSGTAAKSYATTLSATGGTAPYTWSIASGSLPAGLTLSSSGTLSGTPTTAGTSSFSIRAKDSESTPQTASKSLSMTIASAAPATPALVISTTSLPGAKANTAYSTTLAATGGSGSYTWSILSGSLPSGISLSTSGTIAGTTSATGSFPLSVEVRDGSGHTATANETLAVASASTPTTSAIFYSPTSFINTQLPANTPVDPNSASLIANSVGGSIASQAHLSNGSYGDALVYSKSTDKVYSVACTMYDSNTCLVGSSINFPIPQGVTLPSGTDKNTVFVYSANDGSPYAGMEMDCWIPQYNSSNDTWSCATVSLVHNYNGWGTCAEADIVSFHCNGGNAAGFDGGAGPIRPEEIAAGYIPHALAVSINNPGTGIACPATHTDRSGTGVPEGGRFFLPASYNVDAQSWPAWVKTVAHALQNYGAYIIDYGGNFEIKGFTDQNSAIDGGMTWSSVGVPVDGYNNLNMIPWNLTQVETIQWCN
jgi:hypothetical protein